jgi:hypothetical protein
LKVSGNCIAPAHFVNASEKFAGEHEKVFPEKALTGRRIPRKPRQPWVSRILLEAVPGFTLRREHSDGRAATNPIPPRPVKNFLQESTRLD